MVQVRIDSTVTETDILEPTDSRLLYDGVRVLTRLLRRGQERVATVTLTRAPGGTNLLRRAYGLYGWKYPSQP